MFSASQSSFSPRSSECLPQLVPDPVSKRHSVPRQFRAMLGRLRMEKNFGGGWKRSRAASDLHFSVSIVTVICSLLFTQSIVLYFTFFFPCAFCPLALISLFPEHAQARGSLQLEIFGPCVPASREPIACLCWFFQFRALLIGESVSGLSESVNAA